MPVCVRFLALVAVLCFAGGECVNLMKWGLTTNHSACTIEQAVRRYFEGKANTLHVRLHSTSVKRWKLMALHHLTDVLRSSTQLTYRINIENRRLRSNKENSHNFWYVDSYNALSQILPFKKEHFGDGDHFYVIFLMRPLSAAHGREVRRILAKMFRLEIVNVIVIVQDGVGSHVVYSFEVFQKNRCRLVQPVVSNRFRAGRFERTELFPNKLRNFHNCTIRVMSRNIAPFLQYDYKNVLSGTGANAIGIEANMLQLIADTLNFRVDYHSDRSRQFGDVLLNGTNRGPFALLEDRVVDVLIGYFFCTPHRMPYFKESASYMRTTVVAVVKNVLPHENLMWMFDPFQLETWLVLIAFVAMAKMAIYGFRWGPPPYRQLAHRRCRGDSWVEVFGTSIEASNNAVRFAIAVWCGGWVIINAAYQGKLYDAYNHNDSYSLPTLKLLLEQNYTFLLRHTFNMDAWASGFEIPKDRVTRVNSVEPDSMFEQLLKFTDNAAVISTAMRTSSYQRSQRTNKIVAIPETIQVAEFCSYFRHHSYLVQPFNKVIAMIRSSGLLLKWIHEQCPNCNLAEEQQPKPEMNKHGNYPKPLNAAKLTVVFGAFLLLHLSACVVFGFELGVFYLKNVLKTP